MKMIPKWSEIEKVSEKHPNKITFETEEKADKFLKQLLSVRSKYVPTDYWRIGKTVYRDRSGLKKVI